ncbi:hypothetical protein AB0J89_19750 [Micromonospora chokoriensis]
MEPTGVGTVILAAARCERPLAVSPTPMPTQPTPSPTQPTAPPTTDPTQPPTAPPTTTPALSVAGTDMSAVWWLLGTGAAMIVIGTIGRLTARRSRVFLHQ